MIGSELEFFLFKQTYDEIHANNYKNLKPMWVEDHRIKSIKEMKEYHSKK